MNLRELWARIVRLWNLPVTVADLRSANVELRVLLADTLREAKEAHERIEQMLGVLVARNAQPRQPVRMPVEDWDAVQLHAMQKLQEKE